MTAENETKHAIIRFLRNDDNIFHSDEVLANTFSVAVKDISPLLDQIVLELKSGHHDWLFPPGLIFQHNDNFLSGHDLAMFIANFVEVARKSPRAV